MSEAIFTPFAGAIRVGDRFKMFPPGHRGHKPGRFYRVEVSDVVRDSYYECTMIHYFEIDTRNRADRDDDDSWEDDKTGEACFRGMVGSHDPIHLRPIMLSTVSSSLPRALSEEEERSYQQKRDHWKDFAG